MASPDRTKRLAFFVLLVFLATLGALAWFRVGPPPEVSINSDLPGIGRQTPVAVRVAEPRRGLSSVRVELVQGDTQTLLEEKEYEARPFWVFFGPYPASDELNFDVGAEAHPELRQGEATIRVTAGRASTWLRHPEPVVTELTLPVRLEPPSLRVTSTPTYVAQGGSSAVVYSVGPTAVRDGVQVGELWFPGHPLPGGTEGQHFALFGAPHDLVESTEIRLVAVDDVGNTKAITFIDRYLKQPLRTDTIRLSDGFMAKVVPEILQHTPEISDQGDLLANYLLINRDLRRSNAAALAELAATQSTPRFLWREAFRQLPNTRSMASFADRRTYVYEGQDVDQQDHLGFDLASVRQAPVLAANSGVVVMAKYFGIYGNTVVVDHGYGLMSLYAHLSSFEVEQGQSVERGTSLGRTGETGLAGGDHLHFSMLLHGLQVNPLEWWDPSWIENRIVSKLGGAFQGE